MKLHEKFRQIRAHVKKSNGDELTQIEFGKLIGKSAATVFNLENGKGKRVKPEYIDRYLRIANEHGLNLTKFDLINDGIDPSCFNKITEYEFINRRKFTTRIYQKFVQALCNIQRTIGYERASDFIRKNYDYIVILQYEL